MKKLILPMLIVILILTLSGCDYYNDEHIEVVNTSPDENGLMEYAAGISYEAGAARLVKLVYHAETVEHNTVTVKFPEYIPTSTEVKYPIEKFGGPTGTNAPMELFQLIIHVNEEKKTEDPVSVTVDVGNLPLDVSGWDTYVQIYYLNSEEPEKIHKKDVIFLSDQPLKYHFSITYHPIEGEYQWWDWFKPNAYPYEQIFDDQEGGSTVVIKVKHPEEGVERLVMNHYTKLEPVRIGEEYIEYEIIMPYTSCSIDIIDKVETNE